MTPLPKGLCYECKSPMAIRHGRYVPHFVMAENPDPRGSVLFFCEGSDQPVQCRVCGCTEADCSQCIAATGAPCSWIEVDLCSRCVGAVPTNKELEEIEERLKKYLAESEEEAAEVTPASELEPLEMPALAFDVEPNLNEDTFTVGALSNLDFVPAAPKMHRVGEYPEYGKPPPGREELAAAFDVLRNTPFHMGFKDDGAGGVQAVDLTEKEFISGKTTMSFTVNGVGGSIFDHANLSDQRDGNDLLQGLAEMTGDPKLQKLADEGGVAWVKSVHREGEPSEFVEVVTNFDRWLRCPLCQTSRRHADLEVKFRDFKHHFRCDTCCVDVIGEVDDRAKVTDEFASQYQQVPVDLSEEDKQKMAREVADYNRYRAKRDLERGE